MADAYSLKLSTLFKDELLNTGSDFNLDRSHFLFNEKQNKFMTESMKAKLATSHFTKTLFQNKVKDFKKKQDMERKYGSQETERIIRENIISDKE